MPPLPPHTTNGKPGAIRYQTINNTIVTETSLSKVVTPDVVAVSRQKTNASFQSHESGDLTVIGLIDPSSLVRAAVSSKEPVLPHGVHAIGNGVMTTIKILEEIPATAPCLDKPLNWYKSSPYFAAVNANISQLTANASAQQTLDTKANKVPLIILDWDKDTNTHGRKVLATARFTLHQMSLDVLAAHIKLVELNPRVNTDLLGILNDFARNYWCTKTDSECKVNKDGDWEDYYLKSARSWLKNPDDPTWAKDQLAHENPRDRTAFAMHDVVLWAVLWEYFRANNQTFVNMSFSVLSSALRIESSDYLQSSHSFGVAAATDVSTAERLADLPQSAASSYKYFLNVTSGDRSGNNVRGYSQPDSSVVVTALAPDCGYEFNSRDAIIRSDDKGTSFVELPHQTGQAAGW